MFIEKWLCHQIRLHSESYIIPINCFYKDLKPLVSCKAFLQKHYFPVNFSEGTQLLSLNLVAYSNTFDYETDYPALLDKLQLEANAGMGWSFGSGVFIEGIVSGNCLNKANKSKELHFQAYDFYLGLATGYTFR